jgi:hypothetical protein
MPMVENKRAKLSVICVGSGRDGSLSATAMIEEIYLQQGQGRRAGHDYCSRELHQAFADYQESGDRNYLEQIQDMIDDCPFDCIVGNGYAAILPLFYRAYGPHIGLIHLRRLDREACVDSMAEECRLFPATYKYYADDPAAVVKRMAAFHFGHMTREEWNALSPRSRCAWYHDKTHVLINQSKPLFARTVEVQTEALNEERTRQMLAWFISGIDAHVPNPAHLNRNTIDIRSFPPERRAKMRWLLGRLNLHQLAHEDLYGLEYFSEQFIAWTMYQARGAGTDMDLPDRRSKDQIATMIARAEKILERRLEDLRSLRQHL